MDFSKSLESFFDRLWSINRSIMGPGYKQSLKILSEIMPCEKITFKSGEHVLDWTVPFEWSLKDAFIKDALGNKIIDVNKNNLHVVSHSEPVHKSLSKVELLKHIHTLPNQPNAIPYVTSYYKKAWGFCLSENQKKKLTDQNYEVKIDSSLYRGELVIGKASLGPENAPLVMFSSYLCHPSMANNELSGPLVLSHLYESLRRNAHKLKYRYWFIILPETIGSVSLLAKYGVQIRKRLIGGLHLTCIGDSGSLTFKHSRRSNSNMDILGKKTFGQANAKFLKFNPAFGSDERQFCSPAFDLPYCSLSRTIYSDFPEYHTSLDNKSFMSFEGMNNTIGYLNNLISEIESIDYGAFQRYENLYPEGEPQLSKRNLFRDFSTKDRNSEEIAMWWLLNYSDRKHSLFEIANLGDLDLEIVSRVAKRLFNEGVLSETIL